VVERAQEFRHYHRLRRGGRDDRAQGFGRLTGSILGQIVVVAASLSYPIAPGSSAAVSPPCPAPWPPAGCSAARTSS
jgi:hypothetical protein